MSKQAVNDVTFFVSLLFLCCGKRYKIKNMDRDERYFLQVSNADNLHEELFGGGKVSCFMLIQSQCTQCKTALPSHYFYIIWLSLTNTVSDNKIQISILILRRGALSTQCKCNSTHLFLSHVSYYSYVSYKLSTKFS